MKPEFTFLRCCDCGHIALDRVDADGPCQFRRLDPDLVEVHLSGVHLHLEVHDGVIQTTIVNKPDDYRLIASDPCRELVDALHYGAGTGCSHMTAAVNERFQKDLAYLHTPAGGGTLEPHGKCRTCHRRDEIEDERRGECSRCVQDRRRADMLADLSQAAGW